MLQIKNGHTVDKDRVYKFVSAFKDDLTLSNLKRKQILDMCRFIDIPYERNSSHYSPMNLLLPS